MRYLACSLVVLAAGCAGAAHAATPLPPELNPEAIQKKNLETQEYFEQRQQPLVPAPEQPVVSDERKPAQPGGQTLAEGVEFVLQGVRFSESAFLARADLAAVAGPYIGKKVNFTALQKLVGDVDALYARKGLATAKAVLPPQEIRNGIVRIELVEGRLGELRVEGNGSTRAGHILGRIRIAPGSVVDLDSLKRQLVYFNRTSDIQLQAALRPGSAFGLTDVLILAQEPPRHDLRLFLDNQGSPSTGRYQAGASLRYNNLFGIGDSVSAYLAGAEGAITGNVTYSLPVNRRNGRLSVSYARNRIGIIAGPFEQLDIKGNSSTAMLSLQQPLWVTEVWKLDGALALSRTESSTTLSGVSLGDSTIDKASLGASLSRVGARGGWSVSQSVAQAQSKEEFGADRSFIVYDGSFAGARRLGQRWSTVLNAGWQYTPETEIPAAERFLIGGISTVRGYQQGLLSGDKGYYLQLELHRPLSRSLTGFGFVDTGGVASSPTRQITGAGLGLNWRWRKRLNADLAVGYPFNQIVSDQDSYRIDARLVFDVDG